MLNLHICFHIYHIILIRDSLDIRFFTHLFTDIEDEGEIDMTPDGDNLSQEKRVLFPFIFTTHVTVFCCLNCVILEIC